MYTASACTLKNSGTTEKHQTAWGQLVYKRLRDSASAAQNRMEIYKNRLLVIACFGLILAMIQVVCASPRIRAEKASEANQVASEADRTPAISCYESIPCGWAFYTTENRQPFRRISTYTRNRL